MNKDMRFGTWNVTSLYRTGAVTLVAWELAKYRLWRKLHNAELHALYSSPNVIRNLKSRRL